MCGRYVVLSDEESRLLREIIQEINRRQRAPRGGRPLPMADAASPFVPESGDVCPSQVAAVLMREGAAAMRWGFSRPQGSGLVINARAESTSERPMFRDCVKTRRCVVPASGFYEWSHTGKHAVKHLIRRPDRQPFMMAGLYTPPDEDGLSRFVVITRAANQDMRALHDRMPLMLPDDSARSAWLHSAEDARHLLEKPPELRVEIRAVQPVQMSLFDTGLSG